ncbi:MAG: serine/threonine protein kinase, partial [Deltaproteobacteria bacterium]|nr:serine/threonine protein kinase [Deltaproteobacteria bacterium]
MTDVDAPLEIDARVGAYRICGVLGEGAMGRVYLAQDTVLGRRVALKLIRREVMQAGGVARFLEEARATASFNHPHIVTLHAFGEHEGRPYLALEHVDGESLRRRLADGPVSVGEALRCARSIAEAIAEAHRHGLVHADLKPENVVVARDGRVRVLDFGLAKLIGDAPAATSGTPAYMAPERWRGTPPTGAIDVWAIGVILHELITGARPYTDTALARLAFQRQPPVELPEAPWASVVRDCLAYAPQERPAASGLAARLAAQAEARAAVIDRERSPFPGLAVFGRDDADGYFGRAAELDAAVEQLRTHPLVPILGPSGIGKSSFVHAAVVPRLASSGKWTVVSLRPGPAPFAALASAVAASAETLREHPASLSLALRGLAERDGGRVLLVVDQFEEAFTLAGADARAFCECLAGAALVEERWRIVATVRDDFFGHLTSSPAMRPHLGAVLPLAPMSAADLRAAVTGPLARAGYDVDAPELVGRIVADVEGRPGSLPLLQFACASLWERRDADARRILSREFDAIGGASGALAAHAERLIAELTTDQVRLARALLLSLFGRDGTRRPRLRTELLDGLPAGAEAVLDRLLERRLVVAARDAELDVARVEIAHEALATTWPTLARWIGETDEQRAFVTELEQAATRWERLGRSDAETWTGTAITEAERKLDAWNVMLPSLHRAVLAAGTVLATRARRRRRWLVGGLI